MSDESAKDCVDKILSKIGDRTVGGELLRSLLACAYLEGKVAGIEGSLNNIQKKLEEPK